VVFKFSGTDKTIKNSTVTDPLGKTPFSVVSDKKHTKVFASDASIIATIDWDHWYPTIESPLLGNGKKLKIKNWLQAAGRRSVVRWHSASSFSLLFHPAY